jgi:hypothetical protein
MNPLMYAITENPLAPLHPFCLSSMISASAPAQEIRLGVEEICSYIVHYLSVC